MATYLKRTSKLFDLGGVNRASAAEVNLRDLICPVCRGILIEPVTLPCTHNLCLGCLKGTFEHNSLSCPLCRVRVGSWLRTATKSETLVNSSLWELIRTRFPKEVERKHNGDEGDIELDSGFASKKVILCEAGEIRREYEAQLQLAEDEMRRRRETERMANEALIRKIRAEEKEQLAQLEQDQLLAKNLAKKQLLTEEKVASEYRDDAKLSSVTIATSDEASQSRYKLLSVDRVNAMHLQDPSLQVDKINLANAKDDIRKPNISMISKIRAASKAISSSDCRASVNDKSCSHKLLPVHNAVTRTLKQQTVGKYPNAGCSSYPAEPGGSGTRIYGTQSKEELRVPKDLLSSTKKSLGVEVCMTAVEDDERIGSAESAGSHDSINQEIHHFKPIKPMARTALKVSHDGRAIDPKLVRVLPILKRVANAVPKPPSPTHVRRILGCSWSAFRGKARQKMEFGEKSVKLGKKTSEVAATGSSVSLHAPPQALLGKLSKSHVSETVRRLDLAPDMSFDTNKNYAKSINRILNGTKISKRLNLDESSDAIGSGKPSKARVNKNGAPGKNKAQKSHRNESRNSSNGDSDSSASSPVNVQRSIQSQQLDRTIENIAERIKRRKVIRVAAAAAAATTTSENVVESEPEPVERSTRRHHQRKRLEMKEADGDNLATTRSKRARNTGQSAPKSKRLRVDSLGRMEDESSSDKFEASEPTKKPTRSTNQRRKKPDPGCIQSMEMDSASSSSNPSKNHEESTVEDLDEEIIKEQRRMERLILQEKQDFALALRLQSQLNDMERIAGRTRGSRRAMEMGGGGGGGGSVSSSSDATQTDKTELVTHTAGKVTTSRIGQSSKNRPRTNKTTK